MTAQPLKEQEIGRFLLSNTLRRTALTPADPRGREAERDGGMRSGGGETQEECEIMATISRRYWRFVSTLLQSGACGWGQMRKKRGIKRHKMPSI